MRYARYPRRSDKGFGKMGVGVLYSVKGGNFWLLQKGSTKNKDCNQIFDTPHPITSMSFLAEGFHKKQGLQLKSIMGIPDISLGLACRRVPQKTRTATRKLLLSY